MNQPFNTMESFEKQFPGITSAITKFIQDFFNKNNQSIDEDELDKFDVDEYIDSDQLTEFEQNLVLRLNPTRDPILQDILINIINDHNNVNKSAPWLKTMEKLPQSDNVLKMLLSIATFAWNALTSKEWIGVQAMHGPVDQIHRMRVHNGSIQILKEVVEAKMRSVQSTCSLNPDPVASYSQNPDNETRQHASFAFKLANDYDCEVAHFLEANSEQISTTVPMLNPFNPESIQNFVNILDETIKAAGQEIAQRSLRGQANFCIISKNIIPILDLVEQTGITRFYEKNTNILEKHIGTINSSIKVYAHPDPIVKNKIILGYKGLGEVDSAFFLCPYILLTSTGIIVDPTTFEPVMTFMTRYATHSCNMHNYYTCLTLK